MRKFYEALADIRMIRGQIARGTQFRGYGPASIAASGMLAIAVAALEARWPRSHAGGVWTFLSIWTTTAVLSAVFTGFETIRRTQRVHRGFAREMIQSAAEQFIPALGTGILLTAVLLRFAPREGWMLPGLWEVLFSLGVFASCRFLPRQMAVVAAWYLGAGLTCLALGNGPRALSPWEMGVPFGVGQLLVALVLQFGYRRTDA
ncbi:MAG TPA: hypothetical protein VMU86_02630 [Steroidobacteraceae bacterium]|nr:hypothetical protein [Steroidobacteraceae bacterium]